MLGRSACFACGQLGSQLDNVAEPLASRTSPALGFASVARAEVEAFRSSAAEIELDTTLTVADLAYSALRAGERGTSISMKGSDGVLHTPHTTGSVQDERASWSSLSLRRLRPWIQQLLGA